MAEDPRSPPPAQAPPGRILAAIFDMSPDAIAINRATDGVFVAVNESFAALTGWPAAEVQGRSTAEVDVFAEPDDRRRFMRSLREAGQVRNLEMRYRTRSGEVRSGLLSANVLHFGGESLILSVVRDVTDLAAAQHDRAQLEAQLRQAQKMEAMGRLAGGVAHDFNNLLTVISVASGAARADAGDPVRVRECLGEVADACDRAAALTRQLLAFGRRRPLAARPFDLRRLVEDMRKLLGRVIGEDIRVDVHLGSEALPLHGDPNQIEQVVLNLAVNARDAMERGGRLAISAVRARPDELPAEAPRGVEHARLTVTDDGAGMTPEIQAKIFEPFFTTKPAGKGSGLGLSTVYGIVKQHGGVLQVRSAPGRGSTFDVFLPCRRAPAAGVRDREQSSALFGGRETIVLVEDDPLVRDTTRRMLDRLGYRVLAAHDAVEGLDLLRSQAQRVDLLVTDVVMPGMSGPELASRARGDRPGLRVLYVSGYPEALPDDADLLSKPYTPASLAKRVRDALSTPSPSPSLH